MAIGALVQLVKDELAKAEEAMYNFNLLRDYTNAMYNTLTTGGYGATAHGDLTSVTSHMHSAGSIELAAAIQGSTDLETAIQAMDDLISPSGLPAGGGVQVFVAHSFHASTAASCTVTIPANTATNGLIAVAQIRVGETGGTLDSHQPINLNGTDLSQTGGGNEDHRFTIHMELSTGVGYQMDLNKTMLITTAILASNPHVTSIDLTAENIIKFGTRYGGGTSTNFDLIIYAF